MRKRLTLSERQAFLNESASYLVHHLGATTRDAVEHGMAALPSEKRQVSYSAARIAWKTWLIPELERQVEIVKARDIKEKERLPPAPEITIKDFGTEAILQELIHRLVYPVIEEALKTQRIVLQAVAQPVVEEEEQVVPDKPHRKRVLVIGLLPRQERIIRSEFDNEFNLKFLKDTSAVSKYVGATDYILAVTSFISHKHTDPVKDHPGFIAIRGGMNELKDKLTELFINSEAK